MMVYDITAHVKNNFDDHVNLVFTRRMGSYHSYAGHTSVAKVLRLMAWMSKS